MHRFGLGFGFREVSMLLQIRLEIMVRSAIAYGRGRKGIRLKTVKRRVGACFFTNSSAEK